MSESGARGNQRKKIVRYRPVTSKRSKRRLVCFLTGFFNLQNVSTTEGSFVLTKCVFKRRKRFMRLVVQPRVTSSLPLHQSEVSLFEGCEASIRGEFTFKCLDCTLRPSETLLAFDFLLLLLFCTMYSLGHAFLY